MYLLMYHEVTSGEPQEIHAVSQVRFREQMQWIKSSGLEVVALADWMAHGNQQSDSYWRTKIVITFDDGYLDNYTQAWPILQEFGFKATLFLIAGRMGETSHWRPGVLGASPLLTWAQARELAKGGLGLGAHTVTHPNLTTLPLDQVKYELRHARELLEQNLAQPITTLAYPYGGVNAQVKQLVQQTGYTLACSCPTGYVGRAGQDRFDLQRITVLASDTLADFSQKVSGSLGRRLHWYRRQLGQWRREILKAKTS